MHAVQVSKMAQAQVTNNSLAVHTPAVVPTKLVQMVWLVALAVMSAMLPSAAGC